MNTSTRCTGSAGLLAAAMFGALAASVSPPSTADPSSTSVTVKFADLNIASPSGARVLYERIRTAAEAACAYYWFKTDADEARCVHDAIANAVTKINQPAVTAIYNAKYATPAPTTLVSQSH